MKTLLILLLSTVAAFAQCQCDYTISLSASEWFFDGAAKGVKPGQRICFKSGTRTGIELRNIKGTKDRPVVISNECSGEVTLKAPASWGNTLSVINCENIIIDGSANPAVSHGIHITGGHMGLNLQGLTTRAEVHHVDVYAVGCSGILAKTDPTCDSRTWRENFTMRNVRLHHNKIRDTGCEGFYIGNSHYDGTVTKTCAGKSVQIKEHGIDSLDISYNELFNIGNDGIQVGGATHAAIHDNYVNGTGVKNQLYHQNGIQVGGGTEYAKVFSNWVQNAGSFSYIDGGGGCEVYNNVFTGSKEGAFCLMWDVPAAASGTRIYHNTVINPGKLVLQMFSENTIPSEFTNNLVVSSPGVPLFSYNRAALNKLTRGVNYVTSDIETVRFVDPAARDYRLAWGSPAIDAGQSLYVKVDYRDLARYKPDIGAFESVCDCKCE